MAAIEEAVRESADKSSVGWALGNFAFSSPAPCSTLSGKKVELYSGDDRVLGVEISADTSCGFEYERWGFLDAFAFAPGEWMKHLVEIVAL